MMEFSKNALDIPKKIAVFPKMLTRISQRNGINEKGIKGVTLVFSGKKNQMNFCIQTVSKNLPFFLSCFYRQPTSENPLRAWKRMLPSVKPERNNQLRKNNEYQNVREKKI